jgi:hypothetical protein
MIVNKIVRKLVKKIVSKIVRKIVSDNRTEVATSSHSVRSSPSSEYLFTEAEQTRKDIIFCRSGLGISIFGKAAS